MIENGGVYRIGCKITDETIVFEYSFATTAFQEVAHTEDLKIDESYWIEDILDFLDGKQDLYSNFWHKLDPKIIYRLWTCLGANFCNHDLVEKKYRLHFERAVKKQTSNQWVSPIINNLQ